MKGEPSVVVGHRQFVVSHIIQTEWANLIALAFFLGKIGAGLFMVSLFIDYPLGGVVGLIIGVIGKGIAHLLYLGRPERFWRAIMRPDRSWIARGLIAVGFLAFFGTLKVLQMAGYINVSDLSGLLTGVAAVAAFFVMIYDGFVMSHSPSIPLWNTALMPLLCLSYSVLGGVTLNVFLLEVVSGMGMKMLHSLEVTLLATNLLIVGIYTLNAVYATTAARRAIIQLVKGPYAALFYAGVIGVGLVLNLIIALSGVGGVLPLLITAVADLIGHFLIFYLLLKAGLFSLIY
jgi:formate-dependent nitrite reductase membrane component NrfD